MNDRYHNNELLLRFVLVVEQFESMIRDTMSRSEFRQKYSLLDNEDVCVLLRITKDQLTNLRKKGKIAYIILERKVYYKAADIMEYIEKGKVNNE